MSKILRSDIPIHDTLFFRKGVLKVIRDPVELFLYVHSINGEESVSAMATACGKTEAEVETIIGSFFDRGLFTAQGEHLVVNGPPSWGSPNPRPEPKKPKSSDGIDPLVLSIYEAYPRKAAPPVAYKAIAKALRENPGVDFVSECKKFAEWHRIAGTDLQYIPQPATWFNQQRWKDVRPAPIQRMDRQKEARIETLKALIRNSPAFPGGIRYNDQFTAEDKRRYEDAAIELRRIVPDFNFRALRD